MFTQIILILIHCRFNSGSTLLQVYEDGKMSDYIRHWKVGSMAEWRGPFGKFSYSQNKVTHCNGLLVFFFFLFLAEFYGYSSYERD